MLPSILSRKIFDRITTIRRGEIIESPRLSFFLKNSEEKMKFHCPRIKEIYPIYKLHDNLFRVGSQIGITTEISDEDGRTINDVVDIMLTKYPDLTEQDIIGAIELLDKEGVIEEGATINCIKERYHSNIYYFSRYLNSFKDSIDIQKRLNETTILLLGLGGGGSNILTLLSGL